MSDDPRYAMVKATWFRHGAAMTYDYPAQFIAMLDTYFATGGPPHLDLFDGADMKALVERIKRLEKREDSEAQKCGYRDAAEHWRIIGPDGIALTNPWNDGRVAPISDTATRDQGPTADGGPADMRPWGVEPGPSLANAPKPVIPGQPGGMPGASPAGADPPWLNAVAAMIKGRRETYTPEEIARDIVALIGRQPREITDEMVEAAAEAEFEWQADDSDYWDGAGDSIKTAFRARARAVLEAAERARTEK